MKCFCLWALHCLKRSSVMDTGLHWIILGPHTLRFQAEFIMKNLMLYPIYFHILSVIWDGHWATSNLARISICTLYKC
jgi:hypothetical protein